MGLHFEPWPTTWTHLMIRLARLVAVDSFIDESKRRQLVEIMDILEVDLSQEERQSFLDHIIASAGLGSAEASPRLPTPDAPDVAIDVGGLEDQRPSDVDTEERVPQSTEPRGNAKNSRKASTGAEPELIASRPRRRISASMLGTHDGEITSLVVAGAQGEWIASSGADGAIRIWNTRDRRHRTMRVSSFSSVTALALAPDSSWLASTRGAADGSVLIWDPALGKIVRRIRYGRWLSWPVSLAVVSSERVGLAAGQEVSSQAWVAGGSNDSRIRFFDPQTGNLLRTLKFDGSGNTQLESLATSADGRWLAATGWIHHELKLWDLASGEEAPAPVGRARRVVGQLNVGDSGSLFASQDHHTIRVWDAKDSVVVNEISLDHGVLSSEDYTLAVGERGDWLAVGCSDGIIRVFDVLGGQPSLILGDDDISTRDPVTALAGAPDGVLLVSGHESGAVRVWDLT